MTPQDTPQDTPQESGPANDKQNPDVSDSAEDPTFAPSETSPEPVLDVTTEAAPEGDPAEAADAPDGEAESAAPNISPEEMAASRIAELEAETAELNDKLLRALAETENVRRRAQRDREDASKYAIKGFAEDMVRVADNMGRALASIDADARAADANMENLAVGVEMVNKELMSAFERAGVKPIEAMGARFDPMLHEAMFEIQDPDQPSGTVTQVMEDGFTLHGRTLRAAKVGVTKGGPKVTPPKEGDETAAEPAKREGQQAYEAQGDAPPEAGGQVDQEL
ncbi:MAG: nucleotide exchange factor GrpE [Rhodospirillaceae bacterium]|nr:nucleotide exchange factor GrpE [Rhodospirillaceae bacterium]